ncbi:MAG: hypothetical protein PHR35_20545 [Kiritimatiellae bacterium]|nr:hypothetical protein [Kiritimatiellia bacterium]
MKRTLWCVGMAAWLGTGIVPTHAYTQWKYNVAAADTDWFNAANWTAGVPDGDDDWVVGIGAAFNRTVRVDSAAQAVGKAGEIGSTSAGYAAYLQIFSDCSFTSLIGREGSLEQSAGVLLCPTLRLFGGTASFTWTMTGGAVTSTTEITSRAGYYASPENGNVVWNIGGSASVTTPNMYLDTFAGHPTGRTLNQTGGQINISSAMGVAEYTSSPTNCVYNFTGGTLNISNSAAKPALLIYGNGTMMLGDAAGAAGVFRTGPNNANLYIIGKAIGWGDYTPVGGAYTLADSGTIKADGYGQQRDLDFSAMTWANYGSSDNTTDKGVYAVRGGKLKLPPVAVSGTATTKWGQNSSFANLTFVNTVEASFTSAAAGSWTVSLLSLDRTDVYAHPNHKFIGVWDMTAPAFAGANLTFRYDNALAAALNCEESKLRVYRYTSGVWTDVTSSLDTANHRITANGLTSLSQFAVGLPVSGTVIRIQ